MMKRVLAAAFVSLFAVPAFAVGVEHTMITMITLDLHSVEPSSGADFAFPLLMEDVSVVPLPAAGWMLLAGIGGLAALRRRARA